MNKSDDYQKGYEQVLKDINIPRKVIQGKESYYDYEECDDGYYDRAYSLERCPYCGQKLEWW